MPAFTCHLQCNGPVPTDAVDLWPEVESQQELQGTGRPIAKGTARRGRVPRCATTGADTAGGGAAGHFCCLACAAECLERGLLQAGALVLVERVSDAHLASLRKRVHQRLLGAGVAAGAATRREDGL
jgi:hypothetical protein